MDRVISLAQGFTLLNLWNRRWEGDTLYVEQRDIDNAFKLYAEIAECQELGIAPYVFRVFKEVIEPLYQEKNRSQEGGVRIGIERREIAQRYLEVYGPLVRSCFTEGAFTHSRTCRLSGRRRRPQR